MRWAFCAVCEILLLDNNPTYTFIEAGYLDRVDPFTDHWRVRENESESEIQAFILFDEDERLKIRGSCWLFVTVDAKMTPSIKSLEAD